MGGSMLSIFEKPAGTFDVLQEKTSGINSNSRISFFIFLNLTQFLVQSK
jgi:hypothetical protein